MISVIIATHERPKLLAYQLERIVNQKGADYEIIVVNDNDNPDETDDVVKKYSVSHYIKTSQYQGPSQKHIAGMKIAKGEFVYLPDDDDYLTDLNYFKKAEAKLKEDPKLAFVAANVTISYEFDDPRKNYFKETAINVQGRINGLSYLQEFQCKYSKPYSPITTIFRKKAFDEMNAIDMQEMSDSSMHMIALLWGDAYVFEDNVAVWRCKGGGITASSSLPFIMNVIEQKEKLYYMTIGKIESPRRFWFNQFIVTYSFFNCNKNNKKKSLKLLKWGLIHNHGSFKLFLFIIREYLVYPLRRT